MWRGNLYPGGVGRCRRRGGGGSPGCAERDHLYEHSVDINDYHCTSHNDGSRHHHATLNLNQRGQQLDDSDPRNVSAISGNDNPPLGVGQPDQIGYLVAAHTTTSTGHTRVFVLLRNNTNDTARGVEAAVTMRDAGGQLVASGELSDIFPYRIEPGQIGFGEMFLPDVELPTDAAFEFQWSTTEISEDRDDQVDLVIQEHTLQGDQIVAIVENNTDSAVRLVQAGAVCILDNGGIAWLSSSFTNADTLEPGGTSPVTIDMNGQDCPYYIVSARGFDL